MKVIPLSEAKANLSLYGRTCHDEPVIVTVNGVPSFQLVPLSEDDDLIDSLLEASRIQAGGLRLEPTDVHLPRLAEKVVDGFRTQTDIHKFELDFPADFPPIWADPERLQEVLSNLVSNAVKYSPSGGTVWVGGRVDGTGVTVYVADQGIGIPPEEHERIFERFYQVDGGLTRQYAGTGLGLALVKEIVESHGGWVTVESEVGAGSTFTMHLPLGNDS